jgi:integrase
MKNHRGFGIAFQPKYRDKKTGEMKQVATWYIKYSINGTAHTESTGSTNENDAKRLLKQRYADAQMGKPVGSQVERTTLNDLIAMVEADYTANGRRSLVRVKYAAAHLRAFDLFRGGECKAREITDDAVTAYAAHRVDDGAKTATVNYELATLKRAFRLAKKKVSTTPEIKIREVNNARQGFVERDSLDSILRHLPEHLRPIALTGFLTGWRRGEILSRQWRHVDLKSGWLRLEGADSKNGAGREFPINALPELHTLLDTQRERVSAIERTTGQIIPWVFTGPNGSPIIDFRKAWRNACRRAGVPGRLFHDLRRSAVRGLERAGVARSVAMAITGHRTESVYRRYAIVDAAALQEGVAKLANSEARRGYDSTSTVKVSPISARVPGKSL